MYFVKVRDMENNTAKLAYQKPLVELLEVCEIIKMQMVLVTMDLVVVFFR